MPVILNPKLTDAGKAAAVNAAANGLQLALTHVALGTGKYDSATAGAAMTAMVARKEKVEIGTGVVTGAGGFRIAVRFEGWAGTPNPYNATELAFYAGDPDAGGVLFAIFSHPSDVIVQRNSLLYLAQYALQITDVPPGSITISVDPDEVAWMGMLQLHLGDPNPHTQYVRKIGDTSSGHQLGVTAPQHDDTKKFATTEWVKRSGFTLPNSGALAVSGNTTVGVGFIGNWADITAPGAIVTLPKTSDVAPGATLIVRVFASNGLISTQGTDVLNAPLMGAAGSMQVFQGETVYLTRNGSGVWEVLGTGFRMPAGIVGYFAGNAAPPGWIKLNGALLNRVSYPALWQFAQAQGTVSDADWQSGGFSGRFSSGTNGSNFRLPDGRGVFLRSLDDGRGLDAGRAWGTYQDHANRSHNHTVYDPGHTHSVYDGGHAHGASADAQGNHVHGTPSGVNSGGYMFGGSDGVGNNGSMTGGPPASILNVGFGSRWSMVYATGEAGSHQHNISVSTSGSNIGIYGNGTGIQIQPEGSEARPRNLAFVLAIKF